VKVPVIPVILSSSFASPTLITTPALTLVALIPVVETALIICLPVK
jgi:hypothetical protein